MVIIYEKTDPYFKLLYKMFEIAKLRYLGKVELKGIIGGEADTQAPSQVLWERVAVVV